jgi:hypothetical protein
VAHFRHRWRGCQTGLRLSYLASASALGSAYRCAAAMS